MAPREQIYSFRPFNVVRQEGTRAFFIASLLPCSVSLSALSHADYASRQAACKEKEEHTLVTSNQTGGKQVTAVSDGALDLALQKIAAVDVPQGKHIALAYSGGLDSTLCVKLSQLKYHARRLSAITVDVGQGEDEIQQSTERAMQLGISPVIIDAKQEFTEQWLSKDRKSVV